MPLFNTKDFEQQGTPDKDIRLHDTQEVTKAIIKLSESALKSIKIFTPDLEHKLYDNDNFRETLLNFARGNRHANIQILVADISHAVQHGHQLIRLAQKISTAMQIKITPEEYTETNISFILIDQSDFIFKSNSNNVNAIQCNCKNRANKLLEYFTPAWNQAETTPHSQQFHI